MDFRWFWPNRSPGVTPLLLGLLLAGCHAPPGPDRAAGEDVIVAAGRRFHTGTRVVKWSDPGGYNAYQDQPAPRPRAGLPPGRPPTLAALQGVVDQFVLHYDGSGLSKVCFNALRQRKLSVHFLLDVDGTVYQTLDLQERALHATTSNDRSIGIEIANLGAYAPDDTKQLNEWYPRDARGQVAFRVPARIRDSGILTPGFTARPARPMLVRGRLQDRDLAQYDFTPEQYEALIRLTAALHRAFPKIRLDFPHDRAGRLLTGKLPDPELKNYRGLLGHFHIQENKIDPGPALQWQRLIEGARKR